MTSHLERIYRRRFGGGSEYRQRVWQVLTKHHFARFIPAAGSVLDLGCGYGEFINNVRCAEKFAMDANPDARMRLSEDVVFLRQDCSREWELPDDSLDTVFSSNFFEHLPSKQDLAATLSQAQRCLKGGGRLIALGPNIKYLDGAYWDFWDHYLPLTEQSLAEAMEISGLTVLQSIPKFLPHTMSDGRRYPRALIRLYLGVPVLWWLFGRQFLVIAGK